MKILIVDDDISMASTLAMLLQTKGYETIQGYDGQQLLDLHFNCIPDLIITDIGMQSMDGLTAIRELRKKDKLIPVIVMTVIGDRYLHKELIELNCIPTIKGLEKNLLFVIENQVIPTYIAALLVSKDALSAREHEYASRWVTGLLNKQICSEMGIAEATGEQYRKNIREKLKITSPLQIRNRIFIPGVAVCQY